MAYLHLVVPAREFYSEGIIAAVEPHGRNPLLDSLYVVDGHVEPIQLTSFVNMDYVGQSALMRIHHQRNSVAINVSDQKFVFQIDNKRYMMTTDHQGVDVHYWN